MNAGREALLSSASLIVGAYGVSKYDYFRITTNTMDHLHIDAVSIFCVVDPRSRRFYESLTIINQGLELTATWMKLRNKLQNEARKSNNQLEHQTCQLDPQDRQRYMDFIPTLMHRAQGDQLLINRFVQQNSEGPSEKKKARQK